MNYFNYKPLSGKKVLDFSRVLSGPFCSMILADLGAEVIKVEIPEGGDDTRSYPPFINDESSYFMSINRGKKSITLNLKEKDALNIVEKLVMECDIVLENFRPGVTERLKIDYQSLSEINPRLIYCSISSFGQTGPYSSFPGYDLIIQGMGGLMSITGEEDGPPVRVGIAITDICAAMWSTIAILSAINIQEKENKGQYIDISMLDSSISLLSYLAGSYFATGISPKKVGIGAPSIVPYQTFETKDNKQIIITAGNDNLWKKLCGILELNICDDPKYNTQKNRVKNKDSLIPILESIFKTKTLNAWLNDLRKNGFPCAPILTIEDIFNDKHVLERDMLVKIKDSENVEYNYIGSPIKLLTARIDLRKPAPKLGQHTDEILSSIGYTLEEISKLREKHII